MNNYLPYLSWYRPKKKKGKKLLRLSIISYWSIFGLEAQSSMIDPVFSVQVFSDQVFSSFFPLQVVFLVRFYSRQYHWLSTITRPTEMSSHFLFMVPPQFPSLSVISSHNLSGQLPARTEALYAFPDDHQDCRTQHAEEVLGEAPPVSTFYWRALLKSAIEQMYLRSGGICSTGHSSLTSTISMWQCLLRQLPSSLKTSPTQEVDMYIVIPKYITWYSKVVVVELTTTL